MSVRSRRPELYWSVPEAAQRLRLDAKKLRRRIERGDLAVVRNAGGHGLMIAETELRRYEAARGSTAQVR